MRLSLVILGVLACSEPAPVPRPVIAQPVAIDAAPARHARTISLVGTNDLHGALTRLPFLAGYVANLRAARAADGGGVLLVDGGDLFQGTLESNLAEGADVVQAYNRLGYAAAAVGNHEFDYGPVGPAVTVQSPSDDPRGALKARASEAKFPFLVSNIFDEATNQRIAWPNMPASTLVEVDGVAIGIIGVSTRSTPYTTMPANFVGLRVGPPAESIATEATALRAKGAAVIVVVAHIGSKCKNVTDPEDDSSCDHAEELYPMIAALPEHAVDVIVAGHTHAAIAHRINGIAVIESYSSGRAFGRVDLQIDADGHLAKSKIFPPTDLCKAAEPPCETADYEGKPVTPDREVQAIVDAALARAGTRRAELLGVTLTAPVIRAHAVESPEGDLFGDLMLAAHPDAQVAMTNGGGLRADLPAGPLTYGQLYEAMPFDNRFALVDLTGADLRTLVTKNLERGGGIISWGGLTAKAACRGSKLDVQLKLAGKPVNDTRMYTLVTSDFLASGGDGLLAPLKLPKTAIRVTDVIVRDAMAEALRKQRGTIDPAVRFAPRRLDYPGTRPVRCGKRAVQEPDPE